MGVGENQSRCDDELLRQYVRHGSREALGEIARRYTDLVYSAARRHTRDAHLAEDVAQVVFMLLAQRARTISEPSRLVGWLYQTTYFTAANAMRMQRRRRRHEQACAAQREPIMSGNDSSNHADESSHWADVAPVLDDAMAKLDRGARDLLLMRYFQNKSVRQVATETGLSLDAAQKRLSRATQRLRGLLRRRRVAVSAVGVATMLLARSVEPAPAAVHAAIAAVAGAGGGAAVPASGSVAELIKHSGRWWTASHVPRVAAGVLAVVGVGGLLPWLVGSHLGPLAASPVGASPTQPLPVVAAPAASDPDRAAVSVWNESLANIPIPKPWPLAVPGCIAGTPMVADLFGDGRTEIVIPCMELDRPHHGRLDPIVHPHPTKAALLYAFHLDGSTVAGFPVELASLATRAKGQKNAPVFSDDWFASPSVVKIDGKDVIVITGPNLTALWDRALFIVHGDGSRQVLKVGDWKPDPDVPIIATQLVKDGPLELLGGYAEVNGNEFRRSRTQWNMVSGFDFCVGDPNGDGELRMYQAAPRPNEFKTGNSVVRGFDRFGHILPGWPQPCGGQSGFSTVMGDLLGDGKMEILLPDDQDRLLAWTGDGQRFGPTYPEDPEKAKAHEYARHHPMPNGVPANELSTSILKEGIPFRGPLALADIDGDGRPEIVFFCRDHTLRALHGDGTGFGNPDGIIATLPEQSDAYGISMASLGGEGTMDFFLGTYWVHRAADGSTTTIEMLPGATTSRCQPTIVDVDGDGLADVLVGTNDGRVFIYRTGKPYRRERVQWATVNGDLNHTGCWHNPDLTKGNIPGL
jgi:RNA polymerase sigma factor (sigma-70 family)